MAELLLSAILPTLFEKLTSPELLKFATQEGIRSKLNKLKKTLGLINALLVDAEEKQLANGAVKMWLDDLQDLAYDAEDVLDEYATEALRKKQKIEEHQASTSRARKLIPACCISCTPTALWSDISIRSKIDDITKRLQDLCKQKTELGLVEIAGERSTAPFQRPPTTSSPIEPAVFGRDEDKAKILKMVLSDEPGHANFGVISIVGMAGIGKTTLAREVFNATAVRDFYPRAWVCVSDDFDVMRISMAILESINGRGSDLKNLNEVQIQLREKVAGKKFLLVLDDVWSEDYSKWELLRSPFMVGDPRSKIIVTTRHECVALTMGCSTGCTHKLKLLSDDECWSLFKKHAFGNGVVSADASESIRAIVIGKCKGLPLIAKTLGGLLLSKRRDKWSDILNSKLWDLANESEIPAALQISYHHLPSYLKRCFAYCAIFPKDYEFEEKELIFLWMTEGFIQQSSENKPLEDLGGEYFLDLLSRSFFQISSSNNSKYVMHDLINDLAQTVSKNVCFKLEDAPKSLSQIFAKTRYASYTCHRYNDKRKFEVFNDAVHLRTYMSVPQINGWVDVCYISNMVVLDLFDRFKKLRVLSFQRYYIVELPNSIRNLRLLRYLNLSYSRIRSLPKSINSMCNLQTLLLRNCRSLLKLPSDMGNLTNLRHLDMLGAHLIKEMPLGVRKWESLRTLSNFIVGKNSGANLKDLEDLKSLCGELCISRLENVTNFQDTKKVILSDKKDLKVLSLEWTSRFDESQVEEVESQDAKVLDMLQPYKNIEKLTIRCYRGTKFSSWVGGSSFLESNIRIVELIDCKNCTSLPSLGLLGSLKILTIEGMKRIKSIGFEFYGESCAKPFQFLETLCFKDLEEWESWDPVKENDSFPKLQELSIVNCPELSKRLPNNLPSLKKLVVKTCEQLVVSLTNIPTLCALELDECKKIVINSSIFYESLESLTLSNITVVGDWSLQKFKKVQSLQIEGCKELIESWQNEILLKKPHQRLHSLISLKSLNLDNCDTLTTTLFERIKQTDVCLEELSISRCNSLNFIFKGEPSQSLKKLRISDCLKLEGLLDSNEVARTSKLEAVDSLTSHIKDLVLSECPSLTCLHSIDRLFATITSLNISKCSNLTTIDLLSTTLTSLCISNCSNLTTLSLTGHLAMTLKHLAINECSELTTVSPKGHLPETLETLSIYCCQKLESIVDKFHNNNTLYEIRIYSCDELKSFPEGLDTLTSLQSINMGNCRGFTSFPKGGFPSSNLRVTLWGCSKVEALPSRIHTLSSLQIWGCPNISLSEEGLPTKLTQLTIEGHKQYRALMERGLHDFTSLEFLCISGGSDRECIQEEDMTITLPSSLTDLWFEEFPKLKNLPFKGVQDLSSLKFLKIRECPELTSLPSLPSSLERLDINKCPSLKKACKRDKGKEWSKIADIPYVYINRKFIYELEEEA